MFYVYQTLVSFCSALTLIIISLCFGLIFRRKILIIFALLGLVICSTPFFSYKLMEYVESKDYKNDRFDLTSAQAIVVLGGYISTVNLNGEKKLQWGGGDRFFRALEYAKLHPNIYLIFTDEKLPWMIGLDGTGDYLANWAAAFGISPNKILITKSVENTEDEAFSVASLLEPRGIKRIILVTSAFHMKRAIFLFSKTQLEVMPMISDVRSNSSIMGMLQFVPSASALAMTDQAIRELALRFFYFHFRRYAHDLFE